MVGISWKYHMSDISAGIGLANLPNLDIENRYRRSIANRYAKIINNTSAQIVTSSRSATHFAPILFNAADKNAVIVALRKNKIGFGMHYKRNDQYEMFSRWYRDLPGVELYCNRELTLPMNCYLTDDDIERIYSVVLEACA